MADSPGRQFLCVVASQRAGTTAVTRTLGASAHFFNFGEIFRVDDGSGKTQPGAFFPWTRQKGLALDSLMTRDATRAVASDYLRYLRRLAGARVPLIDINFNAWQVLRPAWSWPCEEPFLLRLLKADGAAFVMIRRRDLTQQLLSEVIAWKSGVWHGVRADQLPDPIVAPLDVVRAKAERIVMAERLFQDKLRDYSDACFLTYETLFDGDRLGAGITAFLQRVCGLAPDDLPALAIEKNAGDKRHLLRNYDEVEAEVNKVCRELGREI